MKEEDRSSKQKHDRHVNAHECDYQIEKCKK